MKKMVLFSDLDGTLVDSRDDMAHAVVAVRDSLGLTRIDAQQARPHVNKGMTQLYKTCFSDFLVKEADQGVASEISLCKIRNAYEDYYFKNAVVRTLLYPYMKEALTEVSKMAHIVVITNKPEHISRALLGSLGVLHLIPVIMGGDSCPETKPSILPLQMAVKRLGLENANFTRVMMGDTQADLLCGHSFHAQTIWCSYGYEKDHPDAKSDWTLQTPSDLFPLLQRIQEKP